jgi:hypothetical protein
VEPGFSEETRVQLSRNSPIIRDDGKLDEKKEGARCGERPLG